MKALKSGTRILLLAGLVGLAGCERPPMRELEDASLPLTNSPAIDLHSAVARAQSRHRMVLLHFTGSDWCPPCMELERTVFSRPDFEAYAASNLVYLKVDFPVHFRLPPAAMETNNLLSAQFGIYGVPFLVALDGTGREIWRHVGSIEGGTPALIRELEAAEKK